MKNYQPWNEANHQSQPTARNPKAAAQYYNVVKDECRTCTVVALDLLDSSNMTRYLKSFLLYADGYSKEMDLNSASPDAVGQLPFHGMTNYPYSAPEQYPLTPARRADIERYNTRVVAAPVPHLVLGER